MEITESVVISQNPLSYISANLTCRTRVTKCISVSWYESIRRFRPSCFPILMMNSFSSLHEYYLKIRLHRRDLYQTLAFCGQVFAVQFQLKKYDTCTHDRKQMWLSAAYLRYLFLVAARPCVAVFMLGAAALCTILRQVHQQNPADAPTESRCTTRIRCTPTGSCLH